MSTSSQPPPPPSIYQPRHPVHSSIPMLLPAFIFFFIFMCFLSMFLFRDLLRYLVTTLFRHRQSGAAHNVPPGTHLDPVSGLDPAILSSFPTIPYSDVRGLQEGKCGGVECAVCLSEFNGDDVIRLLTVCCHVFHLACIDSWLASHTTCPVCRSDLEAEPDEATVLAVREVVGEGASDSHVIVVDRGRDEAGFEGGFC